MARNSRSSSFVKPCEASFCVSSSKAIPTARTNGVRIDAEPDFYSKSVYLDENLEQERAYRILGLANAEYTSNFDAITRNHPIHIVSRIQGFGRRSLIRKVIPINGD